LYGIDANGLEQTKLKCAENVFGKAGASVKTRGRRAAIRALYRGEGFFGDDTLAYVDGGKLYYGGQEIIGLNLSSGEKTLLKLGNYLMVFPDQVYVNVNDHTQYGSMNSTYSAFGGGVATVNSSGTTLSYTVVEQLPSDAVKGVYCAIKENGVLVMKYYNGDLWENVKTYVKVSASGIGASFAVGDVVHCTGLKFVAENHFTIAKRENSALYYDGVLDKSYAVSTFSLKRVIPTFDYVTVSAGRLVGVLRGKDKDGKYISRIYASRVNDPFNFAVEAGGIMTDVDICGPFTGICDYLGAPIAFSESEIVECRVKNGAFITTLIKGYGVQDGAHKSICQTRGALYYKSRYGICRYDGSYPELISEDIGRTYITKNGSPAIACGEKYYVCLEDEEKKENIYVYDVCDRLWYSEGGFDVICFALCKGHLYALCGYDEEYSIMLMDYDSASEDMRSYLVQDGYLFVEPKVRWRFESASIGIESFGSVCPIRILLRIQKPQRDMLDIGLIYGDGIQENVVSVENAASGTVTVPITPQRCDSFRIIVSGEGQAEIFGFKACYRDGGIENGWI
jgi:hypothetical protein